jgi:hypothetical protein
VRYLECLLANANIVTVLGLFQASSDTVEASADEAMLKKYMLFCNDDVYVGLFILLSIIHSIHSAEATFLDLIVTKVFLLAIHSQLY